MAYWGRCVALLFVLYHLGAKMHQIYHVCTDAVHAQAAFLCMAVHVGLHRSVLHCSGEKLKGLLPQG